MDDPTFVPAETNRACPVCGAPTTWQPPARRDAGGRVALTYRCAQRHEWLQKEKQPGTTPRAG